jgi:hypothetical protein
LLSAYLDLGDALVRAQAEDKAAAVYGRVLEHEPHNTRARYALEQMGLLEPEAFEPSVDAGAAAADDAEWSVDAADVVTGPADVVADDEDEALWTEEDLLPPLAPDVAADDAGDAGAEPDMVTDAALMAEPDPDALDALDAFEGIQVIEAPVAEPEPPVDESAAPESMP